MAVPTSTVRVPVPRATAGALLRMDVDRRTIFSDAWRETISDLSSVMAQVPEMVRRGPGSYTQQIGDRAHHTPAGGIVPWIEPPYVEGDPPPEALAREQMIWDAALGGPGSLTNSGRDFAELGIDDTTVKARSTAIGNKLPVPPSVSYAAFVTGGIGVADNGMPRFAVAAKPAKTRRKFKDEKKSKAMYWFLRLAFGYNMSSRDYTGGVYTPPKRIGWNPVLLTRFEKLLTDFVANVARRGVAPRAGRTTI